MKQETPEEFFRTDKPEGKECMDAAIARAKELGGTHIVHFEVQDMCSSQLGSGKSVIIGPSCTIKTLEDAGKGKIDTELASTTKWPVAYMEVPA